MPDPKLERLVAGHFEGRLGDAERKELNAMLLASPEARSYLIERARTEAALAEVLGRRGRRIGIAAANPDSSDVADREGSHADHRPGPGGSVTAGAARARWTTGGKWLAAAAAAILGLAGWLALDGHSRDDDPGRREAGSLVGETRPEAEGQAERNGTVRRLEPGDQLREVGRTGNRTDYAFRGTRITAAEGTRFGATGTDGVRASLELLGGSIDVDVPAGAAGIVVLTPAGRLADIGTRFSVEVAEANGLAATRVDDGEVEFTPARGGASYRVGPATGRTSLQDDGSIGTVVDREGITQIRPRGAERWSPISEHLKLEPGDWLRTGSRGAHALLVRLANGTTLLLGPGAQAEVVDLVTVRLERGELEAAPGEGAKVGIVGTKGEARTIAARAAFRADGNEVLTLTEDPAWMRAYKADIQGHALGTLLAKIDGRSVPLSIGYHKVTVDIRDQIARTVVEESFLNHTPDPLEGVFYFPLPAGASISGFGMWIGDTLVEGEIVEKERAREVYEQLVHEKKDPGLLEWSGGNLFTTRVYPISGEKRVRLVYTQVLPREGAGFAYRYSLVNELLRQHPLRDLAINVTVASTPKIESVRSTRHAARIQAEEHSAKIEYSARDVVPDKDFEVLVATKRGETPVIARAHRRGDDGYFVLLVDAPPAPAGTRAGLVPDGAPTDVIVLADTSGSMTGPARAGLEAFLDTLLGTLGPKDRVLVGAADAGVTWLGADFEAATPAFREKTLAGLRARAPLGWTDLPAIFEAAFAKAGPTTAIVYAGDGLSTRGERDPGSVARRIAELQRGRGRLHAVAFGTTYDDLVLAELASLGGSFRVVPELSAAPLAAGDLVRDLALPGIEDLRATIDGVEVAAVHPERVASVPAGGQAVFVGRFDARRQVSTAKATLRGRVGGQPRSYEAPIDLTTSGEDASFIPRLWARRHLDHLLRQGADPALRAQIVALSEAYQIITPYTSFLVLDNDDDRARFGLQKRLRMRDGEEFFAEGRSRADFELSRAQMLLAKKWRQDLRASILRDLEDFGRKSLRQRSQPPSEERLFFGEGSWGGESYYLGDFDVETAQAASLVPHTISQLGISKAKDMLEEDLLERRLEQDKDYDNRSRLGRAFERGDDGTAFDDVSALDFGLDSDLPPTREIAGKKLAGIFSDEGRRVSQQKQQGEFLARRRWQPKDAPSPFTALVPPIPGASPAPRAPLWPSEIVDLVRRIDLAEQLAASRSFRITMARSTPEDDTTSRTRTLVAGGDFGVESTATATDAVARHWLVAGRRGAYDGTFGVGATRDARVGDDRGWRTAIPGEIANLVGRFGTHDASLRRRDDGRLELHFRSDAGRWLFLVDAETKAVQECRVEIDGSLAQRIRFADHAEFGGAIVPRSYEVFDERGRVVERVRLELEALAPEAATAALETMVRVEAPGLIFDLRPREVATLRQAVADGIASPSELFALVGADVASGRFDRAEASLELLSKAAAPLADALRVAFHATRNRAEALGAPAKRLADGLAATARPGDVAAARWLISMTGGLEAEARLALLARLEAVFERGGSNAVLFADLQRLSLLNQLGHHDLAEGLLAHLVRQHPERLDLVDRVVNERAATDVAGALALVDAALQSDRARSSEDDRALRSLGVRIAWQYHHFEAVVERLEAWIAQQPETLDSRNWRLYLNALFVSGRETKAIAEIRRLLGLRLDEGSPHHVRESVRAAISFATGQTERGAVPGIERRFRDELAELALASLALDFGRAPADQILGNDGFRASPAGRRVSAEIYRLLRAEAETAPFGTLARWYGLWSAARGPEIADSPEWKAMVATLIGRFERESTLDASLRDRDFLRSLGDRETTARMLQALIARSTPAWVADEARLELVRHLLGEPWSSAIEARLFELLGMLRVPAAPGSLRPEDATERQRIDTLIRIVDRMVAGRVEVAEAAMPDRETLGRRALRERRAALRKTARVEAAVALGTFEAAAATIGLGPWITLERIVLSAQSGGDPVALADQALAVLGPALAAKSSDEETRPSTSPRADLARYAADVALGLLVRDEAKPEARERFFALLDAEEAKPSSLIDAQALHFAGLVALDHVDELLARLRRGFGTGAKYAELAFGDALSRLLVELDRLPDAAEVLETIRRRDDLDSDQWLRLAALRKVANDRPGEREARDAAYAALDEDRLHRLLQSELGRVRPRSGPPASIDEWTPFVIAALARKGTNLNGMLWRVRSLYEETRDFRLLAGLADATVGMSGNQALRFATTVRQQLGHLVQEEATLDRLRRRVEELLGTATTDSDRRGAHLLDVVLGIAAVDQTDGAAPHVERVLRGLSAAFPKDAGPEDLAASAEYLASLEDVRNETVRGAVLAAMERVVEASPPASSLRSGLTSRLVAVLLRWERFDDAARRVEGFLGTRRQGQMQTLPVTDFPLLVQWADALRRSGQPRAADALFDRERAHPYPEQSLRRLAVAQWQHWEQWIGMVPEGDRRDGPALYERARKELTSVLEQGSTDDHLLTASRILGQLFLGAKLRKLDVPYAEHFLEVATTTIPAALAHLHYRQHGNLVDDVGHLLGRVAGAEKAYEFLLTRAENAPPFLMYLGDDAWAGYGWRMSDFRVVTKGARPELDRRLLALVTKEMRWSLGFGFWRERRIYDSNDHLFWSDQQEHFARVAQDVALQEPDDGSRIVRIGSYLADRLQRPKEAVALLLDLRARKLLDRAGTSRLVDFQHQAGLWAESLPILAELTDAEPEALHHRTRTMIAFHRLDRRDDLARTETEAAAMLEARKLRDSARLHLLGEACVKCDLDERAVVHLDASIRLRVRTDQRAGRHDSNLSDSYLILAKVLGRLGRTREAVDAAAGAIALWPGRATEREATLANLVEILRTANDFEAWVQGFEADVEKTRLENPILRRAIASAYVKRGAPAKAVPHLRAALEATPADLALHAALVEALDASGDGAAALAALRAAADETGRADLSAWSRLAERLAKAGDAAEAERAITNVVELLPGDPASLALLAGARATAGRPRDAAALWAEVTKVAPYDPQGLLGEARALLAVPDLPAARAVVAKIKARTFAPRFDEALKALGEIEEALTR